MRTDVHRDFLSKVNRWTANSLMASTEGALDLSSQCLMLEDVLNNVLRSLEQNLVTATADNKSEITNFRLNAVTKDLSEEKHLKGNLEREPAHARRKISELKQKANQQVSPPTAVLTEENASPRQSFADCCLEKENALGKLMEITESPTLYR